MIQSDSKHTKLKVVSSYIVLLSLIILATILIYKQITKLIINEETSGNANRKLFIIGNTITGLYEAESLSSAFVMTESETYLKKYLALLEETEANIDTLKGLTTNLSQLLRIDSIHLLLEQKVRNLRELVQVKQSFIPDDFYSKAIATIESGKDSLQQQINVRKRYITTVDTLYVKPDKKKKWWQIFKEDPDSIPTLSLSQQVVIDTLNTQSPVQNTDTVVNILKSTWEDVQKQTQDINRRINRKEYDLIRQSTHITDQLKRILSEYEKEEINHSLLKQQNRERSITIMIRIFAWIAIAAFLLAVFFIFFISRDLSRSVRYRKKLENANQYTARLLKSREKMIQTVSHDIKSPLSSIIGYIELLRHTPVNERQHYFLKNMQGSSEHILQLIGNLLDLSKLENNKMPVEKVIFNPSLLFREVTDTFLPLASAKQLELGCQIDENLNKDFQGDALRIRQILTNILSNAVKYTSQGSIQFSAAGTAGNQQVILRIKDTGSGMTEEEQQLIFEEFTRLSSHSAIEGTGLGLTITLKLIHLLGGEIRLDSAPGKGSCFTISLPLTEAPKASGPSSSSQMPADIPGRLRILLVDDDPLQLEMTASLLQNNGIQAETTTQPETVTDKIQQEHYDIIFSDIQMPGINGFELVKRIRQLSVPFASTLPVIALSADSGKSGEDYQKAGFSSYLSKPFTSTQLLQCIRQFCHISLPTQEVTLSPSPEGKGYTLKHLMAFADNDAEATRRILASFLTETRKHLQQMRQYKETQEWDAVSRLAHKMLPLFRQLEASEIISSLEKLEHPESYTLGKDDKEGLLSSLLTAIEDLCQQLEQEALTR